VRLQDVKIDKNDDDSLNRYAIKTQGEKKFCDVVRLTINIIGKLLKNFLSR